MPILRTYVFSLFLLLAAGASAESQLPPALADATPQTLMSVGFGMMAMTDAEKADFGGIIQTFSADIQSAISREVRRNGSNKDRRLKKKIAAMFEELDTRVQHIVTEAKRPGYLLFKKGLADQMQGD